MKKEHDIALLVSGTPARRIGLCNRSLSGKVQVKGRSLAFESSLERDFYLLLACAPDVEEVLEQPVRIEYIDAEGRKSHYTPDVLVLFKRGTRRLYEVKYRADLASLWPGVKPKYRAAIRYAWERGARFQIMTEVEIRGPLLRNAKFLHTYIDLPGDPAFEEHLASTLAVLGDATPRLLLDAAYHSERQRLLALPYLWRMVATGRIYAVLDEPLTMATPIFLINGEDFRCDPHSYGLVLDH